MEENWFGILAVAVTILWFLGILIRVFRQRFSKVTTVVATVIHKQITESFSKFSGTGKAKQHYITFQIGKKRRSFRVSEYSFHGYQKGETGTLKYRGDRLIDFS